MEIQVYNILYFKRLFNNSQFLGLKREGGPRVQIVENE